MSVTPIRKEIQEESGEENDTTKAVATVTDLVKTDEASKNAEQEQVAQQEALREKRRLRRDDPIRVFLIFGRLSWLSLKALAKATFLALKATVFYLRYHPFHALLTVMLVSLLGIMVVTSSSIHANMILGQISNKTVEQLVDASSYTRDFSSTRLAQIGDRELLKVGAPKWAQREAVRAVLFHARRAGLSIEDQAVLLATVEVESGFNPMARASTTTACGLFQFVRATGNSYQLSQSDCMDPFKNAQAGIAHYVDNYKNSVEKNVSGLSGAERVFKTYALTYYLHHDGPNSSNPSNDVKAVVVNGTEFLLRSYDILLAEQRSREAAPSFLDRFSENLFEILHRMTSYIPFLSVSEVQAEETPATGEAPKE